MVICEGESPDPEYTEWDGSIRFCTHCRFKKCRQEPAPRLISLDTTRHLTPYLWHTSDYRFVRCAISRFEPGAILPHSNNCFWFDKRNIHFCKKHSRCACFWRLGRCTRRF